MFSGVKRGIKEFRPKIALHTPKVRRYTVKSLPTKEYTSKECLEIIKEKDKDSDAPYVSEFREEVERKVSKQK